MRGETATGTQRNKLMKTLLNKLANVVKVGGIWLADLVNRVGDPYQEFDRPLDAKYFEYLHEKEKKFDNDMGAFYWPERNVYLYTRPGNSGDQCLWHGIYTTMWALKNSVTRDHFTQLHSCLEGMRSFLVPSDVGVRLIRGWREDGTYEDEVSNDQATGFLAGVYFGWKYGDIYCRDVARELITGFADELAIHGNKLVNKDLTPTKHGKLENGLATDPLNLTLALATYKTAYEITGERLYQVRYEEFVQKYSLLIPYASVRLLWWEKTHHAHRAAIHYSILCDLEKDHDLNRKYLRGLIRTWSMERKSANPWIYYLLRRVCLYDPEDLDKCRKHLKEFTLEEKQYNAERINSDKVETFQWGNHKRCRQPLPRWRVGSQDFFWQRHLYSADDWSGNGAGNIRHNGGDFLVAYWGLRSLRLIVATE